jgi:hypothetical protein
VLTEDERQLLERRIADAEDAYEKAARDFLQARQQAAHPGARRVAFRAHLVRAGEISGRLQGLYDLINADDQEWASQPK